jgi:nucleoside-diphosphate-sugar epimerase
VTLSVEGRKIVLVGGAGFIGHHLALSLVRQGAHVDIIDGLQVNNLLEVASRSSSEQNRDLYLRIINQRLDRLRNAGVEMHLQDARDYNALVRLMDEIDPEVIVHLAAVSHAGRSNKDPFSTFDHSLRTLENSLDTARHRNAHFVYLSSSMVYGDFKTESVDEEHPLDSLGIYGALKVAGERIVVGYQQVFDLPYTIIRPSALYGMGCVSRRVAQIFIENAMSGSNLRIDGDGSERLDFTFVEDLVDGIRLVIEHPAARNQTFNLTYGSSRSVQELAEIVLDHFELVEIEYGSRDDLMPLRGTLSIEKARSLLGYAPRHPIESGIPRYIEWYEDIWPESRSGQTVPTATG